MNNGEVARQFCDGERAGSGSHMYIDGNVLYSYGEHFPMAWRHGKTMYVNTSKYSHTTSKHQSYLRYAISSSPVQYHVSEVDIDTLKRLVDGGVKDIPYKQIAGTRAAKLLVSELSTAGFTCRTDDWGQPGYVKYGEMGMALSWRRWYRPGKLHCGIEVGIHTESGHWVGLLQADRYKVYHRGNLDIASAVLGLR